ncbi:MAG: cell division protein ZapA [Rhodospirillales bacterium]
MAQVSVTINGRKYPIACDDGQEAHLSRLASYVDNRIKELVAAVGQGDHARLLVMVSLLVADELSDAYAELESSRSESSGDAGVVERHRKTAADYARRIEHVAAALEQT